MAVLRPSNTNAYLADVRAVADMARTDLADVVMSLPWDVDVAGLEANRNYITAKVWQLAEKYGNAAASLAADYFEECCTALGTKAGARAVGVMADSESLPYIEESVRYAAGSLFNAEGVADVAMFLSRLDAVMGRIVTECANATMAESGRAADVKVKFARVLGDGEKSCRMCQEWADMGYVWYSDEIIRLHDGCQCGIVPGFEV